MRMREKKINLLHIEAKRTYLFITQLLAERCQQVSELCRRDKTARIFIKMTQSFDKVVSSVTRLLFRNSLVDGQENLEGYSLIGLELVSKLFHI
jgi:hypothetical protein